LGSAGGENTQQEGQPILEETSIGLTVLPLTAAPKKWTTGKNQARGGGRRGATTTQKKAKITIFYTQGRNSGPADWGQ